MTAAPRPPADWEELFDALVELPAAARAERLDRERARDPELASRLERLLAADAAPGGFLERPAAELVDETGDTEEGQLAAGATVGVWRVVRLLGRGGMGEVYLAERRDAFDQRAALKIVRRGMDSQAIVRRFLRERRILAALDHPHIARLLDGGTAPDGRPYFVLDWVDGQPITDSCTARGLDLEARLRLVVTVAQTVDSAHRRLVVHRDLKPANILVTPDGTPKLLDFGIAKLLNDDGTDGADGATLTRGGVPALTPAYAAPEQILGQPVSTATDVYALGVLLYELISGVLPHRRERLSLTALAGALETETVERPSLVLRRTAADSRRVAGDLDLIVLTALQRDPARRYASAAALAEDLERFLAGRPIRARADTWGYRARKFVRRHRLPVAIGALGTATAVALLGLLWQAHAAVAAARRAEAEALRAERVKTFLISIFRQSEPGSGDGARLTARELLDRGASQVEAGLAAEPDVQADLFDAIARIEDNLGLLDPALAHAQRALAIRRARLVPSDGRIGLSLAALGAVLRSRGDTGGAQRTFTAALANLVPAFGEDSLEVARARQDLADSLPQPEQSAQAVALSRQAHATFVHSLGEASAESASSLQRLGMFLEEDRQYAESEAAYRRALVLLERDPRPDAVAVSSAEVDLAGLLDRLGRPREARPLFERAIVSQRLLLGPHHEHLAETLFSYGVLLIGDQDYPAADAALIEALAIFGPDRLEAGHCQRYLGITAVRRERFADAARLFALAAETYRRTNGENDVQLWRALANLGSAHFHLGEVAQARGELVEAVRRIGELAGAESYEIRLPLKMLGEVLTAAGAAGGHGAAETLDEAVATTRRVRALEEKLFSTIEHREVAGSDLLMARALLARHSDGDVAEARRVLDESLGIFSRVHPDDVLNGEALLESGRLALASGDATRARQDLGAAVPVLAAQKGAQHRETVEARRLLSMKPLVARGRGLG